MSLRQMATVGGCTVVGVVLGGLLFDSGRGAGLENLIGGALGVLVGLFIAPRVADDG